jgi:DNA polymerase-4
MRKIIHVDMDCFYAAVEVKYRPELKGKPLGVGGPPGSRAVLTTASYEARKFGVHSAMPSSQAVRLCPQLILVPPNFELYRKESRAVHGILARFTDRIEPLSLDEAYLDVTDSSHMGGSATRIAAEIRRLIRTELGLTASAGIAPNKFLAKLASDWNKPDGQLTIRPQDVDKFVYDLKIEKLWGVGRVTARRMHALGLHSFADVRRQPVALLKEWFGARAATLSELARGIDHREVDPHQERKSLTVEETLNEDVASLPEILARVPGLYRDWETRMLKSGERDKIRGLVVKLKFADFKTTTHERSTRSWPQPPDFEELLVHAWERRPEPVRLIGLGVRLGRSESAASVPPKSQLTFPL